MNQPSQTTTAVLFEASLHRNKEIIKILFDYDKALVQRVKALPGAKR